jgi:nucleotide-binding universal stress UspA family protein
MISAILNDGGSNMQTKIVMGVDGSEHAERAVRWVADYAPALGSEVVVVFAIDLPVTATAATYGLPSLMTPKEREEVRDVVAREWCAALTERGVPFRVSLHDGSPAPAIIAVAEEEDADLVVTGRRGRGGFAELVLGSTGHHLSHHLNRPLVLVP